MTDEERKIIFSRNLSKYVNQTGLSQKEIADRIKVSPQTFNTWMKGIALPRMGKIQLLADYFHINKSDLIDENRNSETSAPVKNKEEEKPTNNIHKGKHAAIGQMSFDAYLLGNNKISGTDNIVVERETTRNDNDLLKAIVFYCLACFPNADMDSIYSVSKFLLEQIKSTCDFHFNQKEENPNEGTNSNVHSDIDKKDTDTQDIDKNNKGKNDTDKNGISLDDFLDFM